MSRRLAYGLVRLTPLSEVIQCDYDFDTGRMGPLQFRIPIPYVKPYKEAYSPWSKHDLWKHLLSNNAALGALVVNSGHLFIVFPKYLKDLVQTKGGDGVYFQDVKQDFYPNNPIGFVRTQPPVKSVTVPPYVLYADRMNRVSIGGSAPIPVPGAISCRNTSLYKQLIQTDHKAVYMTANGPVFI